VINAIRGSAPADILLHVASYEALRLVDIHVKSYRNGEWQSEQTNKLITATITREIKSICASCLLVLPRGILYVPHSHLY
jgi:hypothetical protein